MRGLQILASLLLLAAFCKGDENDEQKTEEIRQMLKECADAQGLTKEQIEDIPRMICKGEQLDKKFSCHAACFLEKLGVLDNGEFLVDEVKKSMLSHISDENTRKKIEDKMDECKKQADAIPDNCDKAVEFTKCLLADTEHCEKW